MSIENDLKNIAESLERLAVATERMAVANEQSVQIMLDQVTTKAITIDTSKIKEQIAETNKEAVETEPEGLKRPELKKALKDAGVEFKEKDSTKRLLKLYDEYVDTKPEQPELPSIPTTNTVAESEKPDDLIMGGATEPVVEPGDKKQLTHEDVRECMRKYTVKFDANQAKSYLSIYGVDKVSQLNATQIEDIIKRMGEKL